MATLKDIARALDVSIPLVSRVLSGRMGTTGCGEATRQAIFAKAAEMGFSPNRIAKALRTGKNGSLGVFVHPLGEAGTDLIDRLLMGLSSRANLFHQRLWLSYYQTESEFLSQFTKAARVEIDGLLVAGIYHPRLIRLYDAIEKNGIPIVTMVKTGAGYHGVNVLCDEHQLGYKPTRHLLEKGCRRIAHIKALEPRYQGYLQALRDHGVDLDPALVFETSGDFKVEAGREAAHHWIEQGVEFDGLVAESDYQAFGAMDELLKHGVRIPEDVKIIGVDDAPVCTMTPIPLSSVSQEMELVGAEAVNVLMKRINNEPVQSMSIQPVLKLRASSGD